MSKIIETVEERLLAHIIETDDGKHYYIDSCDTFDQGYETMAFNCDADGRVKSFTDVFCRYYDTAEDMIEGHEYAVNHLEELINA